MPKYVVEFGVRGGAHTDNLIFPTAILAAKTLSAIVNSFTNDNCRTTFYTFLITKYVPRLSWQSSTHFASVSRLDDIMRGPASNKLWKPEL